MDKYRKISDQEEAGGDEMGGGGGVQIWKVTLKKKNRIKK